MTPYSTRSDRTLGWILIIAFVVPLAFALFTNHVWEDYYITFRASKNLAEGHGLVFQIGERLHTFTSPLGVLLPALLSWLTKSDAATLWLFRLISCAAFSGAAGLMWTTLRDHSVSPAARWIAILFLLGNPASVDFTINGMETGLLLYFGMMTFAEIMRPDGPRAGILGIALAGLMWTRPDAFVPGGAMILAALIFTGTTGRRFDRKSLGSIGRALLLAAVIYGPWFAWAWWYYGTPVPHTILAKANGAPAISMASYLFTAPFNYLTGTSVMGWLFKPVYYAFGGWPSAMLHLCTILAIIAGFSWIIPKLNRVGRAASLTVFIGSFYLQAISIFPWYTPIWLSVAALALGCGAEAALGLLAIDSWQRRLLRSAIVSVIVIQFATLGLSAWQMRQQQHIIEEGNRREIGYWLAANAKTTDTVMLECLGYIGYYSQLRMIDYPGLSSKAVVDARKEHKLNFVGMIGFFKPDWIVLRRAEYWLCNEQGALADYEITQAWDAREQIDAVEFLPGRGYLACDAIFLILKRKPANTLIPKL